MTRLFDYLFAVMVLLLLPILLIVAGLIRLTSLGPALFRQTRIGRNGKPFVCYKLRTMRIGTGDRPSHEVSIDRTTPIGRVLRATKLDELPQALNILRGEMSLVGPRPCLPSQTELIAERRARGVLPVLPGITGLAQINDVDMSNPRRLARVDAIFVRRQSVWLYLQIVAATLLRKGAGDRVRQAYSHRIRESG